jgi:hypothetical protein
VKAIIYIALHAKFLLSVKQIFSKHIYFKYIQRSRRNLIRRFSYLLYGDGMRNDFYHFSFFYCEKISILESQNIGKMHAFLLSIQLPIVRKKKKKGAAN